MNNMAWFYLLGEANIDLLKEREYLGTVTSMQINADYCAVQCCRSGSTGSTCFWASWIRIRIH
jgi:hypothetical protein